MNVGLTAAAAIVVLAASTALGAAEMPRPQWIWDGKRPYGLTGHFRRAFDVRENIRSAWIQISGDDSYKLYLNGEEIARGGFGFGRVDLHEVTDQLLTGRNVIAAVCHSPVDPAGLILRCTINYKTKAPQVLVTDSSWKMSRAAVDGWQSRDFDDSGWSGTVGLGEPPVGPWGPLPFVDMTEDGARIELVKADIPDGVTAGKTLEIAVVVRPDGSPKSDYPAKLSLRRGNIELVPQDFALTVESSKWQEGQPATLPVIRLPISGYAPTGDYELRFGIQHLPYGDSARTEALLKKIRIEGRGESVDPPKAEVRDHKGSPAIWVNGKPIPAMAYADVGPPSLENTRRFRDAGVDLYHLFSAASLGWTGPGRFDFSSVDHSMITTLEGNPNALVFPRVSIQAPEWWLEAHADQIIGYAAITEHKSDVYGGTRFPSMASRIWLEEAGEALRQYVRHVRTSAYADRVIGYQIGGGIYGEWHYPGSEYLPDTSAPMTEAFRRWLRREYSSDVAALRDGWKDPQVTFDTVQVPGTDERFATEFGIFRDPSKGRRVTDYYRCYHEVLTDAILHFARIVKEETRGRSLVGAFYGYTSNVLWTQEGGHWNLNALLDSPHIDFLCSPHTYVGRQLGQDGYLRTLPASVRLHGKFFMDESDDRTHLVTSANQFKFVGSADESVAIMRRQFANVVTQGFGQWWFDMDSCWFDDPRLMSEIASLQKAARRSMELPRKSTAQIAVFASEDSVFYVSNWKSGRDKTTDLLLNEQWRELAEMGAAYDLYELKDLAREDFPEYRCYVFLNCFYVPRAVREAVDAKIKRDGKVALWVYAPGLIDETGLGGDRMSSLTGLELDTGQVGTQPDYDPAARTEYTATKLADWVSVYSRGPVASSEALREVARIAGCHIYSESGDPFLCNSSYAAIHSQTGGLKTVSLPEKCTVRDALTSDLIAQNTNRFSVDMKPHETRVFELTPRLP